MYTRAWCYLATTLHSFQKYVHEFLFLYDCQVILKVHLERVKVCLIEMFFDAHQMIQYLIAWI